MAEIFNTVKKVFFLDIERGEDELIRYNPVLRNAGKQPFVLESPIPTIKLTDYAYNEMRYKLLQQNEPEEAERLMKLAQEAVDLRWVAYEHMANQDPSQCHPMG